MSRFVDFHPGTAVRILAGPHKGQQGTVKWSYRPTDPTADTQVNVWLPTVGAMVVVAQSHLQAYHHNSRRTDWGVGVL